MILLELVLFALSLYRQVVIPGLASQVEAQPVGPVQSIAPINETPPAIVPQVEVGAQGQSLSLFDQMNTERISAGLPAYQWDEGLAQVAMHRSSEMAAENYAGHVRPGESTPRYTQVLREFGYWSNAWEGENIALTTSVELAMQMLMNSPSHRANILETRFTRVGIGVVQHPANSNYWYFTTIFMG